MIQSDNEDQFSLNSQHQQDNQGSHQKSNDLRNSKKYAVIDQQIRVQLLKRILSKEATIKEAAKEFGVNFSTAKAILQTYRKEGRIGKKKTRERNRKQKEDEDDFHVGSARKVQSMCDLEREVQQHRRTFSPDLKPTDRSMSQHPSVLQFTNPRNQIGSSPRLEDQSAQAALALCQRELAQQKLLNMQLLMMIQVFHVSILESLKYQIIDTDGEGGK